MHKFSVGDIVCLNLPDSLYASHFGNRVYGYVYSIRQDGYLMIRWFNTNENLLYWYRPDTEGLSKA